MGLRQRPGYELAKTSAAVAAETAFLNQRSSVAGSSHDRIWSRRLGLSFTPRASSSISTLSALPADLPSRSGPCTLIVRITRTREEADGPDAIRVAQIRTVLVEISP